MRPIDSSYDTRMGDSITALLSGLAEAGYAVETHVTGAVSIDGRLIDAHSFERLAMLWDGTDEGIEALIEEDAA